MVHPAGTTGRVIHAPDVGVVEALVSAPATNAATSAGHLVVGVSTDVAGLKTASAVLPVSLSAVVVAASVTFARTALSSAAVTATGSVGVVVLIVAEMPLCHSMSDELSSVCANLSNSAVMPAVATVGLSSVGVTVGGVDNCSAPAASLRMLAFGASAVSGSCECACFEYL